MSELAARRLSLFEGFGIEIEYMIVAADTLAVRPICDVLFERVAGAAVDEIDRGPIAWSNELAAHLVELKTNGPSAVLAGLDGLFASEVQAIDAVLEESGARLLGTGMHPLMKPAELRLWPGGQNAIYESYDRIFTCRGHGWANLQSVHLNLPFANDEEFARLHRAIRLLLPLLPALSASTPLCEGVRTGWRDYRMEVYRHNADRVPSIAGAIVPEDVDSKDAYHRHILEPMYRAIAPLDTLGVLQEEWLNSRGAIARFDRDAIEIRVLDCQEAPCVDLAIVQAIVAVLRRWVATGDPLPRPSTAALAAVFDATIRRAEDTELPADYVHALGCSASVRTARELWQWLLGDLVFDAHVERVLQLLLREGTLASRIERALPPQPDAQTVTALYRQLADCLRDNRPFTP